MNPGGEGSKISRRRKWPIGAVCIIAGLALPFLVGRAALGALAAVARVRGPKRPAPLTQVNE